MVCWRTSLAGPTWMNFIVKKTSMKTPTTAGVKAEDVLRGPRTNTLILLPSWRPCCLPPIVRWHRFFVMCARFRVVLRKKTTFLARSRSATVNRSFEPPQERHCRMGVLFLWTTMARSLRTGGGEWGSFAIDVANRRRLSTLPRETRCGLARPRSYVADLRRRVQRSPRSSRSRAWGLHSSVTMCGLVSWLKDLQPRHEPSSKGGVDLATTMGRRKGSLCPRGRQVHHHLHLHLHLHVLLQRSPRAR